MKKKSRFSDEEMHRFPIALPKSLSVIVQDYAKKSRKSLSLMAWELIEEAVAARSSEAKPGRYRLPERSAADVVQEGDVTKGGEGGRSSR